jgi:type I restriction enzyme S subunit
MIADLNPYPEYKESEVPWIAMLPVKWDIRRLRHACEMRVSNVDKHSMGDEIPVRLCNYVDAYKNERIRESISFMRASATEQECRRFRICKNDVLITKDSEVWTDIGVPSLVEFEAPDLVCGYHLAILRSRPIMNGAFLHKLLQCPLIAAQLHVRANGVTRYGLSHGAIKGISLPLPPITEQAAIVRFLDWANGRLGRAIRAKRKVIALLNEQKQAIIHRAVTRGLDPTVPLKPSGISWLGDIPQHWDVRRTKNVFRLRTQKSGVAHGKELLSIYTHIGVRPRKDMEQKGNKASTTDDYWIVQKGDLIVNKLLAWMGAVGSSEYEGVTSPAYDILMPIRPLCSDYYHHLFRTKLYLQLFKQRSRGIMDMRLRLYFDQLGQIPVPFPPVDEQAAIVAFYVEATADLTATISRLEREIDLFREYRIRLVADVVTGKLDVLETATQLPEEPTPDTSEEDADLIIDPEAADEELAV